MKAQVVSFRCVLKNRLGQVLSQSYNQDVITSAPGEHHLVGLAKGLENLRKGEKRRIALPADEAYGYYDPSMVLHLPRETFPSPLKLKIGDQVPYVTSDGARKPFRVIQISKDQVVLDGNHPLAGQDLVFEIEAIEARDATAEEMAQLESSDEPQVMVH